MSTGFSLLLIAGGAVLAFAVTWEAENVNVQTIGVILMIVGIIGLAFSLLFLASFAPFRSREVTTTRDRYVDEVPPTTHSHDHV